MAIDLTKSVPHIVEDLVLNVGLKDVTEVGTTVVAVPSVTDPDIAKVDVTVANVAIGDYVWAIPLEALPTNARFQGATVVEAGKVQLTFGSEGGNITGANRNFNFIWFDLT